MAIGYSLRMCAQNVDSTNPGRGNLVFRSKPIAEAEMWNRLISPCALKLKPNSDLTWCDLGAKGSCTRWVNDFLCVRGATCRPLTWFDLRISEVANRSTVGQFRRPSPKAGFKRRPPCHCVHVFLRSTDTLFGFRRILAPFLLRWRRSAAAKSEREEERGRGSDGETEGDP